MLAAATPSKAGKKTNSVVSKAALKKNNEQMENNSNAIELLELSLMEIVRQLREENKLMEKQISEIEAKYIDDNKKLMLKNNELVNQLGSIKKEQVYLRSTMDEFAIISYQKNPEGQEKCKSESVAASSP